MKRFYLFSFLLLCALMTPVRAQLTSGTTAGRSDSGATLPAACLQGELFFKTTAPIGQHICYTTGASTTGWHLISQTNGSGTGDPVAADIPNGTARVWHNTTSGVKALWANYSGTVTILTAGGGGGGSSAGAAGVVQASNGSGGFVAATGVVYDGAAGSLLTITGQATGNITTRIKMAASQTADPLDITQSNGTTKIFRFQKDGNFLLDSQAGGQGIRLGVVGNERLVITPYDADTSTRISFKIDHGFIVNETTDKHLILGTAAGNGYLSFRAGNNESVRIMPSGTAIAATLPSTLLGRLHVVAASDQVGAFIKTGASGASDALQIANDSEAFLSGFDFTGKLKYSTGLTATTVGSAGGASALPATPDGYLLINVNGTTKKVPYYAQ